MHTRQMVRTLLSILLIAVPAGGCCLSRERSISAVHIFGIGWIMHGTNSTRVFGIGSLEATIVALRIGEANTNKTSQP